jgi:glycerol kinase
MTDILALDQGTTSSRAIIFDVAGNIVLSAQEEFRQIFPQPGWVEHDPMDIWTSQLEVTRRVLAQRRTPPRALGITNQRETTLVWDRRDGTPIANAIVWQDRRTAPYCEQLRACAEHTDIEARTGLVLDAYFSATKLKWLLDHVPGARARAERGELAFGTVDTWLIWKLTSGRLHVTDPSNASRTLLYNLHLGQWDPWLLERFNVPPAVLPNIVASSGLIGETDRDILGHCIPITGLAGDQQAATFGQACFSPGLAKNTYGTGCFTLMNTGNAPVQSHNRLLSTVGWRTAQGETHCLEGSVFMGGATVQWLRDGLGIIERSSDVQALAATVADTGDVWLVPAFTGLGAPHWDANARGTLLGMTRGTNRAHIARAALESIALQSAELLTAMGRDAGAAVSELRVDGGASQNDLLMQMQADFSGIPIVRPKVTETTALGAAYLAGLGIGVWPDQQTLSRNWQVQRRFEPTLSDTARADHLGRWQQAVERARAWARG